MAWVTSDNKELQMGIEIEKEHLGTINWIIKELGGEPKEDLLNEAAKRIAQDHLNEMPDYYTRLKEMEKGASII